MQGLYVMLAMAGIFCVVMGVVTLKFPMLAWKLNWSRRMYVKGGEPTEEYFASRRISGVIAVLVGIFFTLGGICSLITGLRGFELPEDTPDLIVEYMEEVSLDYYTIRLGFDGEFVSDRRIVEIKVVDDEH